MICICIIQNASQLTVVQEDKALSEQRSEQRAVAMERQQMVQQKMLLSTMAMSKLAIQDAIHNVVVYDGVTMVCVVRVLTLCFLSILYVFVFFSDHCTNAEDTLRVLSMCGGGGNHGTSSGHHHHGTQDHFYNKTLGPSQDQQDQQHLLKQEEPHK
jgi:hypothetical protein